LRHYFPPTWQVGAQLSGMLFWFLLMLPLAVPELLLFLSESCNAFTQTCIEKEGVSPARIRAQIYGNIAGSILGGHLLHNFGRPAVFATQGLLFLLSFAHSMLHPIEPLVDQPVLEHKMELKSMAAYITLLSMLPDAGSSLFFYYSDELGFTPTQFGYLDALGSMCTLIGTAVTIPYVLPLFSWTLSLSGLSTILVLSRWVLGHDWALVALPGIPLTILSSSLGTQYAVSASKELAYWSTLPLRGRFIGLVLSNALTYGLGVNHNQFRHLKELVFIAALGCQLQMVAASLLLRRTYTLLPTGEIELTA